ncbi:hypothetical protein AOLI_G00059940 [Acnodon oligacanthus]
MDKHFCFNADAAVSPVKRIVCEQRRFGGRTPSVCTFFQWTLLAVLQLRDVTHFGSTLSGFENSTSRATNQEARGCADARVISDVLISGIYPVFSVTNLGGSVCWVDEQEPP